MDSSWPTFSFPRFHLSPLPPFLTFTFPHPCRTTMSSSTVPLLQRQLDTTLQLLISLSSMMTAEDIILLRVRLTEADILMGHILIERDNGMSIHTIVFHLLDFPCQMGPSVVRLSIHHQRRLPKTPAPPAETLGIARLLTKPPRVAVPLALVVPPTGEWFAIPLLAALPVPEAHPT